MYHGINSIVHSNTRVCFAFIYLFVYYLFTLTAFGTESGWLIKESVSTDLLPNGPGCEWPKVWILLECPGASFSVICSQSLSLISLSLGFLWGGENWWNYRSIALPQDTDTEQAIVQRLEIAIQEWRHLGKNTYFTPTPPLPLRITECHWSQ